MRIWLYVAVAAVACPPPSTAKNWFSFFLWKQNKKSAGKFQKNNRRLCRSWTPELSCKNWEKFIVSDFTDVFVSQTEHKLTNEKRKQINKIRKIKLILSSPDSFLPTGWQTQENKRSAVIFNLHLRSTLSPFTSCFCFGCVYFLETVWIQRIIWPFIICYITVFQEAEKILLHVVKIELFCFFLLLILVHF